MTGLLVSVRDCEEAAAALEAGADLIDVKEPSHGALGMAAGDVIRQVVALVAGRVPTSAALGELAEGNQLSDGDGSPTYAKFGLAGASPHWQRCLGAAIARLPAGTRSVAVAYADWQRAAAPHPRDVLRAAEELRCAGVLLDTFDKSRGSLVERVSQEFLAGFCTEARRARLRIVIAGGLTLDTLSTVRALNPDFIGVRGAVCRAGRGGMLDAARVRTLVSEIHARSTTPRRMVQGNNALA